MRQHLLCEERERHRRILGLLLREAAKVDAVHVQPRRCPRPAAEGVRKYARMGVSVRVCVCVCVCARVRVSARALVSVHAFDVTG